MSFSLNSQTHHIPHDWVDEPLLLLLREHFGLTGAKFGCGVGICGACTILIDGVATGEVKDLRAEALALKELVVDLSLENRLLKKSMSGEAANAIGPIEWPNGGDLE